VGLSVGDLTLGTTVGNLGFEKVEFPKPVFIGDTLYAESEVLEVRPSKSHPNWGIVILEHRARNQRNETVMRCKRAAMMLRKPNK
jgi:acyl dehydratase